MTTDAPFKVYAPDGAVWSHSRLAPWSTYLRVLGWWGWLPYQGVRQCTSVYPQKICGCGQYALIWKEQEGGSEKKD